MREINGVTSAAIDLATQNDPWRVYDWKVTYEQHGKCHEGALGRTHERGRSRMRVEEELRALPADVPAMGEITRGHATDPTSGYVIATAVRRRNGEIRWTTH